jgi:excisionase family DNA binding protein
MRTPNPGKSDSPEDQGVPAAIGRPSSWASVPLATSVSEAAKIIGIGRNSCYALVARGELSAVRIGRRVVIPRQAIEQLLATNSASDVLPANPTEVDRRDNR